MDQPLCRCRDCDEVHDRAYEDCRIPEAPFYVLSYDSFFSRFSFNGGRRNTPVVPCQSWEEVSATLSYIRLRGDQQNIRVVYNKPKHRAGRVLNLVMGWHRVGGWSIDREAV